MVLRLFSKYRRMPSLLPGPFGLTHFLFSIFCTALKYKCFDLSSALIDFTLFFFFASSSLVSISSNEELRIVLFMKFFLIFNFSIILSFFGSILDLIPLPSCVLLQLLLVFSIKLL